MPPARSRVRTTLLVVAAGLMVIGILSLMYYGGRSLHTYRQIEWSRSDRMAQPHADEPVIRTWMTIRFVSKSYGIPEDELLRAAGLAITPANRTTPIRKLDDPPGVIDKLTEAVRSSRPE